MSMFGIILMSIGAFGVAASAIPLMLKPLERVDKLKGEELLLTLENRKNRSKDWVLSMLTSDKSPIVTRELRLVALEQYRMDSLALTKCRLAKKRGWTVNHEAIAVEEAGLDKWYTSNMNRKDRAVVEVIYLHKVETLKYMKQGLM